jgi:hypothetical protein
MSSAQSVTIGQQHIELHTFTGEVVDEKKWTSTQVSSSGGGYNVGSGQNNPVSISSSSETHDQFFLKDETGREQAIELTNANVAIRKGHRVTVIWGILRGQERGPYLAIYNHNTSTLDHFNAVMQSLVVQSPPWWEGFAWGASILAICFYGVGIIGVIVLAVKRKNRFRQNQENLAALKGAVAKLVEETQINRGIP